MYGVDNKPTPITLFTKLNTAAAGVSLPFTYSGCYISVSLSVVE